MTYLASFLLLLSLENPGVSLDPEQLFCQATAVYHEARGESAMGQVAVAYVVQNRIADREFPDDACSVVYAPEQFTDVQHAKPDYSSQAWKYAVEAAAFARLKYVDDPTGGALWYYNPKKATWRWWRGIMPLLEIGNHRFLGRITKK